MTQPVENLYVELVSVNDKFQKDQKKATDAAFKDVEKSAARTSDNITSSFSRAGANIRNTFRDVGIRIRESFSGVNESGNSGRKALEEFDTAGRNASKGIGSIRFSLEGMIRLIRDLANQGPSGIAILSAAFVTLAGSVAGAARVVQDLISITALAGASLPGLITGLIASFLILKSATSGIGEAFEELTKQETAAGSAGVSNARAVADAQRGVLQAQRDLIKAKEDEIKRVRTLAVEIQRARATEARAADDVLKAEFALQRARAVGTPRAVIEAQLALDEANATLVESKDKTKELAAEKAKADRVGINGSDQVLRAQEALLDAQDRLAQSQQRISAGAAATRTAFNGLTKSAQDFVLALVDAQRQLEPLQNALQEAFFSGTAPLIQPIVDNLLELQPELVRVAAGFGNIFKEILTFLGSSEAKDAIDDLLTGLGDFLTAITPSIGPLLEAFAGLIGDSGKFGTILGGNVAIGLNKIADFVSKVDFQQVFTDAKAAIKELAPLISNLAKIAVSLFRIFAFAGKYILPIFVAQLNFLANVFGFVDGYITDFKKNFNSAVEDVKNGSLRITAFISAVPAKLTALGKSFLNAGKALINSLFSGINSAGGFATDFAKNLANTFVRFFNNTVIKSINNGVKAIQDGLNKIPGLSLSLPKLANIPALAEGGLSTQETLARISEGNRKEAVLPLEDNRAMRAVANAISKAGGAQPGAGGITFAPGSFVLNFQGALPTDGQARAIGATIGEAAARTLENRNIRTRLRGI